MKPPIILTVTSLLSLACGVAQASLATPPHRLEPNAPRSVTVAAIARDYVAQPANTIIVSPDNRSRQEINKAVRVELRKAGLLVTDGEELRTLAHRSDMAGADRSWAARYNVGDVLQYTTGSKAEGIERNSFSVVRSSLYQPIGDIEPRNGKFVRYTRMGHGQKPNISERVTCDPHLTACGGGTVAEPASSPSKFDAKAIFISRFVRLLADNEPGRIFDLNHVRGPLSKAAPLLERLSLGGRAKVGFEKLSAVQS